MSDFAKVEHGQIMLYPAISGIMPRLLIPFQQEIGRAYHASCLFFGKKSC